MKISVAILAGMLFIFTASSQTANQVPLVKDTTKKVQVVETACGQCQFGLTGKGCNLAVRINGKSYFVDGTDIDSHGDAHASDGFCNAIRKAEVQGTLVNNRFLVNWFQLIEPKPAAPPKKKNR
jgi:hypothetical protein